MRFLTTALEALMEDLVPPGTPLYYDVCRERGDQVAFTLTADLGVRAHRGERIEPEMAEHTDADLEVGARLLLLRASRRVRPEDVGNHFAAYDLPPVGHSLEISEFLVGGRNGVDIERGDALLALTDPDFLGLVVRQGTRSSIVVYNPAGVVRVDPNAQPLPPPVPRRPRVLETQVTRQARICAERRARALLFKYLNPEQKWELRAHRRITVTGQDGRVYRIYAWQGMNVRLVEGTKETSSLCIVPKPEVTTMPVYDLILAQKVLLENDVSTFLKTAVVRTLPT